MKISLTFFVLFALCSGSAWAAPDPAAGPEFFESKIRPVLVKHCYQCHSAESGKSKGGLQLDSRAGWQVGGDSGPAIVPKKPKESLVIQAISRGGEISEMPPKSRLSSQVVSDFTKWIAAGAIDPRDGKTPTKELKTIDIEAGRKFWAFQPHRPFSKSNSIDGFIRPQAPRAPADQLVRRLFLDLIGLPPTLDERKEFLRLYNEQSPDAAVDAFTDQLLARKEFGEKWARHWLDVARYADSNGGDFNLTFPESWRYRNYVIAAFNRDVPYDQFLREQIAGDLMTYETPEQRNRQLIATGFLMVAPKMLTERNKAKMHLDIADEQVDTIGRAIMGLTLGCARCHDHKFDPIPTADYYALAGILHSTRTADRVLMGNVNVTGWTETDLAMDEETQRLVIAQQTRLEELQKEIKQKKAAMSASQNSAGIVVDDTEAERTGPWRKSNFRTNHIGAHYLATDKDKDPCSITWKAKLTKPGKYELRVTFGGGNGLATTAPYVVRHADGETRLAIDQTVKPSIKGLWHPIGRFTFGTTAEVQLTDVKADGHVIADAIQLVHLDDVEQVDDVGKGTPSQKPSLNEEIKSLEKELVTLTANAPKVFRAMAAKDHSDKRRGDLHIRIRGEATNLGHKAPRGFLQVASDLESSIARIPADQSGRLELAQWLTQPNHPLTARVMVNRIWQQLFGQGIVVTSDNFGTRGVKPTHPELLDHLAEEFIANDWSMKYLIREIIRSHTYQQAALTADEDDPENLLLRRQNRRPAPAETIRDSILAIAGELDRKPRDSVVELLGMYAIETSGKRHASLGQTGKLRQRSIYMPIVRGAVPPSLAVFDLPNPDLVTGTRAVTTVPAQALFMMNSPFVRSMAKSVSLQVTEGDQSNEEIIQQLYRRILIRDADADDLAIGKEYITQLMNDGKSQQEAIASFVQILFSSTEFRFIE
jgi:cytochrome c553